MSETVARLQPAAFEPFANLQKVDPECVAIAQRILDLALKGEIDGIAAVLHQSDDQARAVIGGMAGGTHMVGQMEFLKARILASLLE